MKIYNIVKDSLIDLYKTAIKSEISEENKRLRIENQRINKDSFGTNSLEEYLEGKYGKSYMQNIYF